MLLSLIWFDCIGRWSPSFGSQLTFHLSITSSAAVKPLPGDERREGMEKRRVQQLWIIDVGQEGDITREQ